MISAAVFLARQVSHFLTPCPNMDMDMFLSWEAGQQREGCPCRQSETNLYVHANQTYEQCQWERFYVSSPFLCVLSSWAFGNFSAQLIWVNFVKRSAVSDGLWLVLIKIFFFFFAIQNEIVSLFLFIWHKMFNSLAPHSHVVCISLGNVWLLFCTIKHCFRLLIANK